VPPRLGPGRLHRGPSRSRTETPGRELRVAPGHLEGAALLDRTQGVEQRSLELRDAELADLWEYVLLEAMQDVRSRRLPSSSQLCGRAIRARSFERVRGGEGARGLFEAPRLGPVGVGRDLSLDDGASVSRHLERYRRVGAEAHAVLFAVGLGVAHASCFSAGRVHLQLHPVAIRELVFVRARLGAANMHIRTREDSLGHFPGYTFQGMTMIPKHAPRNTGTSKHYPVNSGTETASLVGRVAVFGASGHFLNVIFGGDRWNRTDGAIPSQVFDF
jgi:hypothetical protein